MNISLENWIPLVYQKLEHWGKSFIEMLPNYVLAAVIVLAFYLISKVIRNFTNKLAYRASKSESLSGLFSGILQALILIFGLITALNVLHLEKTVSSMLAGAGILGLALGFAFQDLTANFISGAFMALRRPFEIGDKVETNGFIGTIFHMQLRATTLRTTAGLHVVIPNKEIFQKPIINYSRSDERRVELEFTVLNTFDLASVESIIQKALENLDNSPAISDITIYYISADDTKVKLAVSFHIDNAEPKGFFTTRHKAIVAVYKAFADNGIVKIAKSEEAPHA